MRPSKLFFALRVYFECSNNIDKFLKAYPDSAGVWTIGLGTTYYPNGDNVKEGDTCTEEEAYQYSEYALDHFINHLNATLPGGISQWRFDALLDFCYNAGQGAWDTSTLRKTINNYTLPNQRMML